jgi:hypothetical protein
MKRLLAVGFVLAASALARATDAPPPPVQVRAHAEPDTVTVGSRLRYVVEVTSARDAEVFVAQASERVSDEFEIVDFGGEPPVTRDGKTILTRWYTLVSFTPGDHLIKSPPVRYRQPGEEMADAPGAEIRVSVESVLEKAGKVDDIRDIKPPEEVPIDWRPYELLGAGVLGALALVVLLYRLVNRPKRARPAPPPRPPDAIAIEALEALRRRGLDASGMKAFYSELSAIVRTYLEQRFEIRAPEMTTEEFLLVSARGGRLVGPHRALLGDFLKESDLVKFARHLPTVADGERAWAAARRFVDETRAAPEALRAAG